MGNYKDSLEIQLAITDSNDFKINKTLKFKTETKKNKKERDALKEMLPSICFSGEFTQRSKAGLINHSGLICLDFDKFENMDVLIKEAEARSIIAPSQEEVKELTAPKRTKEIIFSMMNEALENIDEAAHWKFSLEIS